MFTYIKNLLTGKSKNPEEQPPGNAKMAAEISSFYTEYDNDRNHTEPAEARLPTIYGNVNATKTMLLVDDQESVFYLYDLDFESIKKRFGYDILNEFKIVRCDGNDAGFTASKYIQSVDNEIVVGILDLTLGTIVKLSNGKILLRDGVDLALELIDRHPRCKIGVCTAHMLNDENPAIMALIHKFNKATGRELLDYAFSKNSDRPQHIFNLIQDVINNNYDDYGTPGSSDV